jgi:hypothetical protein
MANEQNKNERTTEWRYTTEYKYRDSDGSAGSVEDTHIKRN